MPALHNARMALLATCLLLAAASAEACAFARGGALSSGEQGGRRALHQAVDGLSCRDNSAWGVHTPPRPTQAAADAKVRNYAHDVIMNGGGAPGGAIAPGLKIPKGTGGCLKLDGCINWTILGGANETDAGMTIWEPFTPGAFIRIAFHDCGTFKRTSANTGVGGCDASFIFEAAIGERLPGPARAKNPNSDGAMEAAWKQMAQWRSIIDAKIATDATIPKNANGSNKTISMADMIQLGGAATVIMGGGATKASLFDLIPMGRVDATTPNDMAQLPGRDNTITRLLCIFQSNGYTFTDLVALSGAHTMGGDAVGLDNTPQVFDVDYFGLVRQNKAEFKSDNWLYARGAPTRAVVDAYFRTPSKFKSDFALSYVKMGLMGAAWKPYSLP